MTATLYELGAEWARLESVLIESGGEVTPEVEAALADLGELEGSKVDPYYHVIGNLTAHAKSCQEESDRLAGKARVALNGAARLKERLLAYMQARGVDALQGERWRACVTKNGGKRPLTLLCEPDALPKHLQRVRIEPDTDGIRAVLTSGGIEEIADVARLEPAGTHLRFR